MIHSVEGLSFPDEALPCKDGSIEGTWFDKRVVLLGEREESHAIGRKLSARYVYTSVLINDKMRILRLDKREGGVSEADIRKFKQIDQSKLLVGRKTGGLFKTKLDKIFGDVDEELLSNLRKTAQESGRANVLVAHKGRMYCLEAMKAHGNLVFHLENPKMSMFGGHDERIFSIVNKMTRQSLDELQKTAQESGRASILVAQEGKIHRLEVTNDQGNIAFSLQDSQLRVQREGFEEIVSIINKMAPQSLDTLQKAAQASASGEASLLVAHEGAMFRLVAKTIDQGGTVTLSLEEPKITKEWIQQAGFSEVDAEFFEQEINKSMEELFQKAVERPVGQKQEVGIMLSRGGKALDGYAQLHVKKDGTITIGIEKKKFAAGGLKAPYVMSKFGPKITPKIYVEAPLKQEWLEAPPKDRIRLLEQVRQEWWSLEAFKHENIAELRGHKDESIPVKDLSGSWIDVQKTGPKTVLYEMGDAASVVKKPLLDVKDLKERIKIFLDASKGLSYIHSITEEGGKSYCHMDFKPQNLFLEKNKEGEVIGKVGDVNPVLKGESGAVVTWRYAPPEVVLERAKNPKFRLKASTEYDVWSFGASLLEGICGANALNKLVARIQEEGKKELTTGLEEQYLEALEEILKKFTDAHQNEQPFQDVVVLIKEILQYNPAHRPTMAEISEKFEALYTSF